MERLAHCEVATALWPEANDSFKKLTISALAFIASGVFPSFAACAKRGHTGAMRTAWKKIRYRLEWLGLKSAKKFLPLLSRKACYRLALLLGSLGAMLDRRGRRVAVTNLRVAFGDEISSERCAQIVREFYQHFARTMLDFFWSPRLTSQNFSRHRAL